MYSYKIQRYPKLTAACLAALALVIVFIIVFTLPRDAELEKVYDKLPEETKLKEKFKDLMTNLKLKLNDPLIFKHQYLSIPGNCTPWSGCSNPSPLANAVSLETKKRYKLNDYEDSLQECTPDLVYKDCNLYQDCIDGKCVSKLQKRKK